MASFCCLPLDLILCITSRLDDAEDLASCRLVNKQLCVAASAAVQKLTVQHIRFRKLGSTKLTQCFPALEELVVQDKFITRYQKCPTVWELPGSLCHLGIHLSSHFYDNCFRVPGACTVVLECATLHLTGEMKDNVVHLRTLRLCPSHSHLLHLYTRLETLYLHVSANDVGVLEALEHLQRLRTLSLICKSEGVKVEAVGEALATAGLQDLSDLSLIGLDGGPLQHFSALTSLTYLHIGIDAYCSHAHVLAQLPLKSLTVSRVEEGLLEACNLHTLQEVTYDVPDLAFVEASRLAKFVCSCGFYLLLTGYLGLSQVFEVAVAENSSLQTISAPLCVGGWLSGCNWPIPLVPAADVRFGNMPQVRSTFCSQAVDARACADTLLWCRSGWGRSPRATIPTAPRCCWSVPRRPWTPHRWRRRWWRTSRCSR